MNKQRNKSRGQRPSTKKRNYKENYDEEFKGQRTSCASNDVAWYARTPEILNASANIGFSRTVGMPDGNNIIPPGVMVLPFVSSIGGFNYTGINQAANSIYSYVVHANSRNVSYSSADLMMLLLAGKEVFNGIANLIRAYGLMLQTNQENSYLPKALLIGCGLSYESVKQNYSHMLYDINRLIADSRQIWLPNIMPVVTRQFWMSTSIYMDSDNTKGQYYMFAPAVLRIFDEKTDPTKPTLNAHPDWNIDVLHTWAQAVEVVDDLIKALVESESRGVIFGDILKAYGEENIFKVEFIDSNYTTNIVYDQEVLSQIENSTSASRYGFKYTESATVIQINNSTNTITEIQNTHDVAIPTEHPYYIFPEKSLLNFHFKGQPTAAQIMVATRLMALGNAPTVLSNTGSKNYITGTMPKMCGTEYILSPYFIQYYVNSDSGAILSKSTIFDRSLTKELVSVTIDKFLKSIASVANFDWAPMITYGTYSGNSDTKFGTFTPTDYLSDVDNYIVLTQSEVQRMHNCAILSEFGVPVLA